MKKFWIVFLLLLALACTFAACNEEEKDHTHVFGEWEVTTKATCTKKGEQTCVCECGEERVRKYEASHTFDAENICIVCGEYQDKAVVFKLNNGTYTVTGYTGTADTIIIPSKYQNIPVTCIGVGAFRECKTLKKITIPSSVTTIESLAFSQCALLEEIHISEGVTTIGSLAFANCKWVKSIAIPTSITSIGSYAFDECDPENYTTYKNGKYLGNDNNPYLYLLGMVDKNVDSFEIHNETKFIGNAAFLASSLTSIVIPDNVVSINSSAFYGCAWLSTVTFSPNTRLMSIGSNAFNGCNALRSFEIPASVKVIEYRAFSWCVLLSSATFNKPGGWSMSKSFDTTTGTSISATDLADPATAAKYLRSTYCDYNWIRAEE